MDAALGGIRAGGRAQYETGIATAIVWMRRTARRQGRPRRSKLDPQRHFLLGLVEHSRR
jgi:hypothetical protein